MKFAATHVKDLTCRLELQMLLARRATADIQDSGKLKKKPNKDDIKEDHLDCGLTMIDEKPTDGTSPSKKDQDGH